MGKRRQKRVRVPWGPDMRGPKNGKHIKAPKVTHEVHRAMCMLQDQYRCPTLDGLASYLLSTHPEVQSAGQYLAHLATLKRRPHTEAMPPWAPGIYQQRTPPPPAMGWGGPR